MRLSIVVRAAVVLLVDGLVLLLLSELLRGFTLDGVGAALWTAALVGVLNALVWPRRRHGRHAVPSVRVDPAQRP